MIATLLYQKRHQGQFNVNNRNFFAQALAICS